MKRHSFAGSVVNAGWELEVSVPVHMDGPFHVVSLHKVVWASSQHGGWLPKEPGSCLSLSNLALGVTKHHFCLLQMEAIRSPLRFKGN